MTTSNSQSENESRDCGWTPCRGGEISSLVGMLKRRCRNRQCGKVAAGAAVLLLALGIVWINFGAESPSRSAIAQPNGPANEMHGNIACSDVLRLKQGYVDHTLNDETLGRIDAHLRNCPRCLQVIEQLRNERLPASAYRLPERGYGQRFAFQTRLAVSR